MNFDKESNLIFCGAEGGRRWEGGRGSETKTVSQTVKRGKIKKNITHLLNVKHVIRSTFQNT